MKWNLLNGSKIKRLDSSDSLEKINENILEILLENRGIKTEKEKKDFLDPKIENVTIEKIGIDKKQLSKTLKRIKKAIDKGEKIIIYGDYDVDGITATAILWEVLFSLKANVDPYIPHRVEEGYGLSIKGIDNLIEKNKEIGLIITVDNGIVAEEAVNFANENKIDVIITDHHTMGEKLPASFSLVHTTKLCGGGIAFILAKEIMLYCHPEFNSGSFKKKDEILKQVQNDAKNAFLDLVTLATIADLVPLRESNRAIVKNGLDFVRNTKRIGLQMLYKEAGLIPDKIGIYEIGHIIAPRLNAMGRLESAMDSLRLLCTRDLKRAQNLALILGTTNRERQLLTQASSLRAIEYFKNKNLENTKILFIHDDFEEGIIGLVAGRLVEYFYKPAIVVSKKNGISKASARSISGVNIIEFIRRHSDLLVNAGGHPMAAGFSVETEKLILLKEQMEKLSIVEILDEHLERILNIDLELLTNIINFDFYETLQKLAPFGMQNPEPVFLIKNLTIENLRIIGKDGKHVKLTLSDEINNLSFEAIAFNMSDKFKEIKTGDKIDFVFTLDINEWNNEKSLQLKIKDINLSPST